MPKLKATIPYPQVQDQYPLAHQVIANGNEIQIQIP